MAADETPVTLDDLATVGLERIEAEYHVDDLGICRRCGGVVFMSPYSEDTHRRWHAAIEDLTVTVSAEVPADFFDNSPPTITAKGSHMLRIPFTPDQRRDLVVTLGLDPNRADHCTWEAIMGRVRQHAAGAAASAQTDQPLRDHLIQRLTDGPAFRTETEVIDWLMPVIGVWRGEVERLRRVEDALIAVGAPNHSRRGDPGGLMVAWIQRQAELMSELRAKDQAAKQAVKLLADRPTRDAYVLALEEPERCRSALVEALGLDQNTGFYAALDVAREWRRRDATITRRHHALLMLAAKGRKEYADGAPDDQAQKLEFEADVFLTAANLVAQPNRIGMLIPYRMQTAVALAEVGVDYPVDQVLSDLLLLVGETVPVERMRKWSQKDREEVARWAGLVHLQASDNDVDVPERPAFLDGPAETEVCPSLYLTATGHLVACQQPKVDEPDLHTAMLDGHRIAWREPDAVPSPWPVDQEPPAGINLLRDTGSQLVPYLARVQNGWGWLGDPNGSRTHGAIQWAEAVLDVDGDLVVVRP